ncbi:MAG: lysylphosphatidylglycerol synthase transmembrane domain-containing protein [Acidimicrobiia bacterium]
MTRILQITKKRLTLATTARIVLILVSIGLLARFVLVSLPEVKNSLVELRQGDVIFLWIAVAMEVIWTFALSQVYRSGLKGFGGRVTRRSALRISMASFSISRIVPGGGAAGSAWAAREFVKEGNTAPRTVMSMIASWWISMTGLAVVVTSAIGVSVALGKISAVYLAGPGTTLVIFVGGGIVIGRLISSPRFRARLASRAGSVLKRFDMTSEDFETEMSEVASNLRIRNLVPIGGWAILSWVVDAAALGLTFAAFGSTLGVGVLMVGYGLANLISALPELTPGWLGVLEATLAGTYGAFGVPAGTAVLAVLSYRLVSYWLPVFVGLIPAASAIRSGKSKRRSRIVRRVRAFVPAWSR